MKITPIRNEAESQPLLDAHASSACNGDSRDASVNEGPDVFLRGKTASQAADVRAAPRLSSLLLPPQLSISARHKQRVSEKEAVSGDPFIVAHQVLQKALKVSRRLAEPSWFVREESRIHWLFLLSWCRMHSLLLEDILGEKIAGTSGLQELIRTNDSAAITLIRSSLPHGILADGRILHTEQSLGTLHNGAIEGSLVTHWPDGHFFAGEVHAGLASGQGRMIWPDIAEWTGNFEKTWPMGAGRLVMYSNKKSYEGNFRSYPVVFDDGEGAVELRVVTGSQRGARFHLPASGPYKD